MRPFSSIKTLVRLGIPAFFVCATLLASVPFHPEYPTEGIDPAWKYAMNEAVAKGMKFGSDIVFTFGPYASAYSCQYHPFTDQLMLASSAILGLGFALGALTHACRDKRLYLLPIPFLIALLSRDSFLFLIPMLFMLLVFRESAPNNDPSKPVGRFLKLSLALLAIDLSLLTLTKFSFGFAALVFILFGFVLLVTSYPKQAYGFIAIYVLALSFFWLLAKQPFSSLPRFFIAQVPMISGYSEAMSLPNDLSEIIRFSISAIILLIVIIRFSIGRLSR
ncbi:MAG: hypothetical protein JOY96_07830, partial [Verrucomicrobia bacterium]|nr:hypothetical protein [Verrucomicrobiota bacterium]